MASIQERTSSSGETKYRVQVRLRGRPAVTKTFKRKTDAKRWAQQKEQELQSGLYFPTAEAERRTLTEAIERYYRDVLDESKSAAKDTRRHLDWWKSRIGDYRLSDISAALVTENRDALRAEPTHQGSRRAPGTVNRYLTSLSHVFTIALKEWEWARVNPVQRVGKLREPQGRIRYLSEAELKRLLAATESSDSLYLHTVVLLAVTTGMRLGEILALRWKDIDLKRGQIVVEESKNGERRGVSVVSQAAVGLQELAGVRRLDSDLVFPGVRTPFGEARPASIRTAWEKALREAAIVDFRFHDLRHTCGSYLAMNGATPREIAEILGQKTIQMAYRYSHLSQEHTANLAQDTADRYLGRG